MAVCSSTNNAQIWNTTSGELGWEMRYVMETTGYDDCASLVVLHEDYLIL
ncbi:unnamed protein product [Ectocarpus sp. 6 AP-2014]